MKTLWPCLGFSEEAIARRVAENLTSRISDLDLLAVQAAALPIGAVVLESPEDPVQRRLLGRAASRIWEVKARAEDVLRYRDPDVAYLLSIEQEASQVEQVFYSVILARALWLAVGIRATLRDEIARISKSIGRSIAPMRTYLPKDEVTPPLDRFETTILQHPEGRRLIVLSNTIFAAWPFWALNDEVAPKENYGSLESSNQSDISQHSV